MGLNETNRLSLPAGNSVSCRTGVFETNCLHQSEANEDIHIKVPPSIVPCYNGETLKIHEELVMNGLSAISIKHNKGKCKEESQAVLNLDVKKKVKEEDENRENDLHNAGLTALCYKDISKNLRGIPECLKGNLKVSHCSKGTVF